MDECSNSSLLCYEREYFEDEEAFIVLSNFNNASDDDYYVEMLISREINSGYQRDVSLVSGDWLKQTRLEAITWILKSRATFRFRFQTVYLSVTYFDRFLYKRFIDKEKPWTVKLLSVACLSLAAKMEEQDVPALSEFKLEDYSFESKVIQRMELLILDTLDWKMGSITPFPFLHYFITKFSKEPPPTNNDTNIFSRSLQLLLTIMKEINLIDHRPSIIAAAVILVASDGELKRKEMELKMSSLSLKTEDIIDCYNMIRGLDSERSIMQIQNPVNSPDLSTTHLRMTNSSEVTSAVMTKRKRLAFGVHEQRYDMAENKRLC